MARNGANAPAIHDSLRELVVALTPLAQLRELAKPSWRAILSTTLDTTFELALRRRLDKSPAGRSVTAISDFGAPVPPRTVPMFYLLGSIDRPDFVISSNDYRVRRASWRQATQGFADEVRGHPVLCVGFEETTWLLLDLLAEFVFDPKSRPGPILLLADDPVLRDQALVDLGRRGLRFLKLDATLGQLVAAIMASEDSAFTSSLPFERAGITQWDALSAFAELATPVNLHVEARVSDSETSLLHDLLFSPTTPRWDPFIYRLDLPRTITGSILSEIRRVTGRPDSNLVLVSGPAACGKTTVLKRAALELARDDHIVMWLRPYFFQDGATAVHELTKVLAAGRPDKDKHVIIFIDDPLSLGTLQTQDIAAAASATKLDATFVVGVRSSDLELMERSTIIGTLSVGATQEVPEIFDESEWEALPEYLVRLGVAEDIDEAQASVTSARGTAARDVLAMLFWLLPDTRRTIRESVHAEYLRLGDQAAFSQLVVGELNRTSQLLKDAYEYVAVAENFGSPVPIEVLVSALGVSYEDWLAVARDDGLTWGLLYAEESSIAESTIYRTRNDVVTNIIVRAVNGGVIGRSGEVQRLGRLIRGCTGASPAYREFCLRILIPSSRKELDDLDYEEGNRLYEDASNALVMQDRTLVHHHGLWQKNHGHDPVTARETLRRALETKEYPYSDRGEPLEHIHTSLAATELDAIRSKMVTAEQGRSAVLHHLERARSEVFLNPNAVHVQARMTIELVDLSGQYDDPDSVALVNAALADVDRALMLVKSPFARRRVSTEALEDIQSKLLERFGSLDQMTKDAARLWKEFARQDGFVLVARRMYGEACRANRGRDFNQAYQYCKECRSLIADADQVPGAGIAEVMLHIYYQWRARRSIASAGSEPIDWVLVRDLAVAVRGSARSRTDPFYQYVCAVAEAHLGEWSHAEAIFHDLRRQQMPGRILWEPRDCLLHEMGGMRQVQGVVRRGGQGTFLKVDALGCDFRVERDDRWPPEDQVAHAYIRFCYWGAVATTEI